MQYQLSFLGITLFLFTTCVQAGQSIVITGSSTILPVMRELAMGFEKANRAAVEVSGGGSAKGLADVINGRSDIGMVSRTLSTREVAQVASHLIGFDGVAVIIHASNPVTGIGVEQIRAIYEGRVRNWAEIGGPDLPVEVLAKAGNRATRSIFDDFFRPARVVTSAELVGSNAEMIVLTGISPGAIGYVSIGAVEKALAHGVLIKALPLHDIQPTHDHIKDRSYKLLRLLNLVTRPKPTESAKKFIDYVYSSQGGDIIAKYNYVAAK